MNDVSEVSEALSTAWSPTSYVQGEEEDVSSSREEEDDENSHRKFIRRNMPLYLPRIIIPRQGSLGWDIFTYNSSGAAWSTQHFVKLYQRSHLIMILQYSWWKLAAVRERSNPLTGRLLNFKDPPLQYIASVKWKFSDSFTFRAPQQME